MGSIQNSLIRLPLLVCLFAHWPTFSASQSVEWMTFDDGIREASRSKKYIYLNFHAEWCQYCELLENTTLREPSVIRELSQNFISIKIDTESPQVLTWEDKTMTMKEFCIHLGVMGLPTLLFLNHTLEIVGSYPSYADRELMLNLLTYISSGAREKQESFEDFLSRKEK